MNLPINFLTRSSCTYGGCSSSNVFCSLINILSCCCCSKLSCLQLKRNLWIIKQQQSQQSCCLFFFLKGKLHQKNKVFWKSPELLFTPGCMFLYYITFIFGLFEFFVPWAVNKSLISSIKFKIASKVKSSTMLCYNCSIHHLLWLKWLSC